MSNFYDIYWEKEHLWGTCILRVLHEAVNTKLKCVPLFAHSNPFTFQNNGALNKSLQEDSLPDKTHNLKLCNKLSNLNNVYLDNLTPTFIKSHLSHYCFDIYLKWVRLVLSRKIRLNIRKKIKQYNNVNIQSILQSIESIYIYNANITINTPLQI